MPRKTKQDASFVPRLVVLRKACGLSQIQLAEAASSTLRSICHYKNDDGPLGLKVSKAAPVAAEGSEMRRLWKRFQVVTQLPEKDQCTDIRLVDSFAGITPRKGGVEGELNGR